MVCRDDVQEGDVRRDEDREGRGGMGCRNDVQEGDVRRDEDREGGRGGRGTNDRGGEGWMKIDED